jgi:hypothetical protein
MGAGAEQGAANDEQGQWSKQNGTAHADVQAVLWFSRAGESGLCCWHVWSYLTL